MTATVSKSIMTVRRTLVAFLRSARSEEIVSQLRAAAPYALMELILPGGSVMALLLWLYRRRKATPAFATPDILLLL